MLFKAYFIIKRINKGLKQKFRKFLDSIDFIIKRINKGLKHYFTH